MTFIPSEETRRMPICEKHQFQGDICLQCVSERHALEIKEVADCLQAFVRRFGAACNFSKPDFLVLEHSKTVLKKYGFDI